MIGIITRIKYTPLGKEYTVTDGGNEKKIESNESISHGIVVKIEEGRVTKLAESEIDQAYKEIEKRAAKSIVTAEEPSLVNNPMIQKLWPKIKEAAGKIMAAKKLGRSILLRFHGDADGISGAIAISSIVNCKAFQQNSAIYSVKDALRDLSFIGQENRPLMIFLDFGSTSKEGLNILKAGGIEYMIIDHHPIGEIGGWILNPFSGITDTKENPSRYTAGYLGCEIAAACGMNTDKALWLARIACSGDKSDLIANDEEDGKKALVLDFLASHVSFGNNLDFYKKVMDNEELFFSIAHQAEEGIGEASAKAIARIKKSNGENCEIVCFSLEGIARKDEWPPSGKITTRVFDKLNGSEPLICIGYNERSIIMRLNNEAVGKGFGANMIAEKMKNTMPDFVESGGGHAHAGAIRVREGFVKEVLGELVRSLGGNF